MKNRMKPLLATYDANRSTIDKIASDRIEASGEHERMCKQLDGPEFTKAWRNAEMRIVPDQKTASLICHHVARAQEILRRTVTHLDEPFMQKAQSEPYPRSHRCKIIRELPETLLSRLQPVFSQSALFDPAQEFKKQFDGWRKSLVSQLDQAERNIEKGKGYQIRRFEAYREIFAREYPVIEAWFDGIIKLLISAESSATSSLSRL